MKTIETLIEEIKEAYSLSETETGLCLALDPRALKAVAEKVCSRPAKISAGDILEVSKWGINWDLSRYQELRRYA